MNQHTSTVECRRGIQSSLPGTAALKNFVIQSALLEALPDLCFVLDRSGQILEVNSTAVAVLDTPVDTLLNAEFITLLEPSFEQRFRISLEECFSHHHRSSAETHLILKDGSIIPIALSLSSYISTSTPDNDVCLVVARDISETKNKELDLLRFYNVVTPPIP